MYVPELRHDQYLCIYDRVVRLCTKAKPWLSTVYRMRQWGCERKSTSSREHENLNFECSAAREIPGISILISRNTSFRHTVPSRAYVSKAENRAVAPRIVKMRIEILYDGRRIHLKITETPLKILGLFFWVIRLLGLLTNFKIHSFSPKLVGLSFGPIGTPQIHSKLIQTLLEDWLGYP